MKKVYSLIMIHTKDGSEHFAYMFSTRTKAILIGDALMEEDATSKYKGYKIKETLLKDKFLYGIVM